MTEYIVNADEENSLMYGRKYEELIRCKDCKWYEMSEGETYCRELGIFDTDPTSYCSYAKRAKQ